MRDIVPNLRDVGGMSTVDGHAVLPGRVLRSAMPAATGRAPDGIVWPPALVIDLRSAGESEPVHPLARSGARIVNLPLLSALRPGTAPAESLHSLYLLVLDHASMFLVELVREVGQARGAALIHCAAGKDRTGVSIALLLRLVDVPREQVHADYRATADAEQDITARLRKLPGRQHRSTLPASFFDVSVEALDGVLDVWDDHEGGVHGWFRSAGGSDEIIDQLRRTLLT
ncbi:tyrosine-protein phosphatase [Aeromicrobium sp.]|uniref:tyrosine-protein phosphatase n=1 Tax=Aeromicrobium sp. TaxID=1871063 RepID=UPI0019CC8C20|nr:tyrosine-protein phosphatase [Aeromicrobium sp.]MBC7631491.1 tyrosine-protein phosphatase [Aeromicrobium sp.]